MREFTRVALLVINIIAFGCVLILGFIGALYEVFNAPVIDKLLEGLGIPLSLGWHWAAFLTCFITLIVTYFLRKKVLGE